MLTIICCEAYMIYIEFFFLWFWINVYPFSNFLIKSCPKLKNEINVYTTVLKFVVHYSIGRLTCLFVNLSMLLRHYK